MTIAIIQMPKFAMRHLDDSNRHLMEALDANDDARIVRTTSLWQDAMWQAEQANDEYQSSFNAEMDEWLGS